MAGVTATELAVVMPAVLLLIMLVVQYGLWAHARQVATAAAQAGVDAARVPTGTEADASAAAHAAAAGSAALSEVVVSVHTGGDSVTVRVDGVAPRLVPGIAWHVAAATEAPLERFVPANQRFSNSEGSSGSNSGPGGS